MDQYDSMQYVHITPTNRHYGRLRVLAGLIIDRAGEDLSKAFGSYPRPPLSMCPIVLEISYHRVYDTKSPPSAN